MADGYVDYGEVSEYGRPFVTALAGLVGLSEFVDVTKLGAFVSSKVDAVETELQKARNDRSDVRDERGITAQAEETLRDTVTRFYHHLQSLPKTTNADVEAFFSGRVMGDIAAMKPADLVSKAADVLRGFDTEKNKVIAGLASWKTDIAAAWQNLADAIEGKGGAAGKAFLATAELVQARNDFLHAYNKVAKHIVRGLLNQLGRGDEMPLFFKDLAVHERGGSTQSEAPPT